MPVYKVLGQSFPAASSFTSVYTVPASTSAVVSSIVVAATSSSGTFDIYVKVGGSLSNAHLIYKGIAIGPNDTFVTTVGITLAAGNQIVFNPSTSDMAINVFGTEIT